MVSDRVLLRKEPEGGYTVVVPSLPGCITYGKTIEESVAMTREAIALYIESLRAHGEVIPPSKTPPWSTRAPFTNFFNTLKYCPILTRYHNYGIV